MECSISLSPSSSVNINKILYDFKIDKKIWSYDNLIGEDYDIRRSKPAPYIRTAIKIANIYSMKTVIEIGSTRLAASQKCVEYFDSDPIDAFISPPCCCDGHATYFWARAGFETHTVDVDSNCLRGLEWSYGNLNEKKPDNLHIHIPVDGIEFLQNFTKPIDVLYLDGWDKGTPNFAENHLNAYLAAQDKLSPIHMILIDDTDYVTPDGGKDKLLSPFLIEKGYTVLFNGRQTLFINDIKIPEANNTNNTIINQNMEQIFSSIYRNCSWGNNGNSGYLGSSGDGSSPEYNIEYMKFVKNLIKTHNIRSIADAGCGDWRLGSSLFYNLDIKYTGYDVYNDVIKFLQTTYAKPEFNFIHLDIFNNRDNIENADLFILKDVMQHWDDPSVKEYIDWIIESKKFKFTLVTNCTSGCGGMQEQGSTGGWRGLSSDHPLFKDKRFFPVLKYNTKEVMLYMSI